MDYAGINQELVNVFQEIGSQQSTGILYVYKGEDIRYLYFENGKLIYLSFYVSKEEKIGETLISSYKISPDMLQEAFSKTEQDGVALKEVLIEHNIITPTEFKEVTRRLVEDEFCKIFSWAGCQTSFEEGPPDPQIFNKNYNTLKINIDVGNLIKWIKKKMDENRTILQWIPSADNSYVLLGDRFEALDQEELLPLDKKVAEFLDGNYTVENICYQLRQDFFKVGKSIVKLMTAGAAELSRGEGPTTNISREIQQIQQEAGAAPQEQPASQESRSQSSAETTGEAPEQQPPEAGSETVETIEGMPSDMEGVEPASSQSKNLLAYESHTKRNLLIAAGIGAGVLFIVWIIWMCVRVTPGDRLAEFKEKRPKLIQEGKYDEALDILLSIKTSDNISEKVKKETDRIYKSVRSKVNAEAEEDIRKARELADGNKLQKALDRLYTTESRSVKADPIEQVRELISEYENKKKEYTEKTEEIMSELSETGYLNKKNRNLETMMKIGELLYKGDKKFGGFPLWEEKKSSFIPDFNMFRDNIEEKLKDRFMKMLEDSTNVKKVDKEVKDVVEDFAMKNYLPDEFLITVRKKIVEFKSKAKNIYTEISANIDKWPFNKSLEKLKEFKKNYPWFNRIDSVNKYISEISDSIKENEKKYNNGMALFADENYKKALENFKEISELSVYYSDAKTKIRFLTKLNKALEGWQDPKNRQKCAKNITELLAELEGTISDADSKLLKRWREKILNYDPMSMEQVDEVTAALAKTNDIKEAIKGYKKVIRNYPKSKGMATAEEKLKEIETIFQTAKKTANNLNELINEGKYKEARGIKEDFLEKYPSWSTAELPDIPLYVKAYPKNTVVKLSGEVTKEIKFHGKKKVELTASAPGFKAYSRTVQKIPGKTRELIVLNKKAEYVTKLGHECSAPPVLSGNGILCTFNTGVILVNRNGEIVWDKESLEIQPDEEKGIKFQPVYSAELQKIFVLGEKNIYVLNAESGAKIKEEPIAANPETRFVIMKDPLIGKRYYLYYATFSRDILCLNAGNLKSQWPGLKTVKTVTGLANTDEYIVAGARDENGTVYAIDFRDGFKEMEKTLGSPVALPVETHSNEIIAVLKSGVVSGVNLKNRDFWQSPKISGENGFINDIEIAGEEAFVVSWQNRSKITKIDLSEQGEIKGSIPYTEDIFFNKIYSCKYDNNILYCLTSPNEDMKSGIWAYNLNKQEVEWQYFENDLMFYQPVFTEKEVYVVSRDGRLFCFSR